MTTPQDFLEIIRKRETFINLSSESIKEYLEEYATLRLIEASQINKNDDTRRILSE